MKTLLMIQRNMDDSIFKKDKWQNKDDQNVKVVMAFEALINRAQ